MLVKGTSQATDDNAACPSESRQRIVVRLVGGLGNQLFQYALGRRLSLLHGASLKLDISDLERASDRSYRLRHFDISAEIAADEDLAPFQPSTSPMSGLIDRFIQRCKPFYRRHCVWQQGDGYDERIWRVPPNAYLVGYWQSEKYFADIRDVLLRELRVVTEPSVENLEVMQRLSQAQSVSLHVRRGDYVTHPGVRSVLNTCSVDYYRRAVRAIARAVRSPEFFVFSDDPTWAKNHLKLDYPTTFVENNGPERDYEDLRLMSCCKAHIIANSTFSWWGAWLSTNPSKIVVAPKHWYRAPNRSSRDLIPSDWIKV